MQSDFVTGRTSLNRKQQLLHNENLCNRTCIKKRYGRTSVETVQVFESRTRADLVRSIVAEMFLTSPLKDSSFLTRNGFVLECAMESYAKFLVFFFELCCARHYNCGSHWAVLVLSLLDKGIKRKGQGQ